MNILLIILIFVYSIQNSTLQLAESAKECYPDEDGSLSGSMISLAHSNSSTSFPYIAK